MARKDERQSAVVACSSGGIVAPAEQAHVWRAGCTFQEDCAHTCANIAVVTVASAEMHAMCQPWRTLGGTMAHENLSDIFSSFLLMSAPNGDSFFLQRVVCEF